MNKRLWLSVVIILIILFVLITLNINKGNLSLKIKGSASHLIIQAKALEMKGNLQEAKAIYKKLINEFPNSRGVSHWQKKIEDLNLKLLFSSAITDKSILYVVSPGDTLTKIANKFKTTTDLIKKSNSLATDKILPGKRIKVWTQLFSIVVDKSQNILILKTDEEIIKTYVVSTGANNSTPTGNFKIINKLMNPTWFKAGAVVAAGSPENILGSRWLGFNLAGYGIHGTTDPQSLGKQVTQGCIRMSNPDIEELYTVIPIDTEVTIVD